MRSSRYAQLAAIGIVALAASCSRPATSSSNSDALSHASTSTTIPAIATGPCAEQPAGCGSPQGSASELASAHWSVLSPGPLSARTDQSSLWTGSDLLVWGGVASQSSGGDGLADGAAYRPATNTWQRLAPAPMSGRGGATAVWIGDEAMVWGGESVVGETVHALSDGAIYDTATQRWHVLSRSPLTPRTVSEHPRPRLVVGSGDLAHESVFGHAPSVARPEPGRNPFCSPRPSGG